jgi:hypothetical protein
MISLIFAAALVAQNDAWVPFSDAVALKYGSLRRSDKMSTAIARIRLSTGVEIYHASISSDDCSAGYGTVYFFTLNGLKPADFTWAFAFGAGNVASNVAHVLCNSGASQSPTRSAPQVWLKNEHGLAADDATDDNDYDDARS